MFESFTFTPDHQPDEQSPVEFQLKPIDQPTGFMLTQRYAGDGITWPDMVLILKRNIVGWKGLPVEYSDKAKADFVAGEFDYDMNVWIAQCARELYNRRVLKERQRKN